jgi:hypothetical protein
MQAHACCAPTEARLLTAALTLALSGQVFLQSDVLDAVAAMRDEYEQHAIDVLQLSPLHTTAPVFHWTQEQEYAALAAAAATAAPEAADAQADDTQQEEQQQDGAGEMQQEDNSLHIPSATPGIDANGDGSGSDSSKADGHAEVGISEEAHSSEGFVSTWAEGGWLVENPLGVPTERENYVQNQGGKVFRVLLVKKQ